MERSEGIGCGDFFIAVVFALKCSDREENLEKDVDGRSEGIR